MKVVLALRALLPGLALALPAINPHVPQATMRETICRPGYSATAQPSTTYTSPIKWRFMAEAGIPPATAQDEREQPEVSG